MNLTEWAAKTKRDIYQDLENGLVPSIGDFDLETLKEGRAKSSPQMGSTVYSPRSVRFEYLFNDPTSSAVVFSVVVTPPERIVFLPVPEWVVESIWQGDIDGSHHFESDAARLIEKFVDSTKPENNVALFGKKQPTHRE